MKGRIDNGEYSSVYDLSILLLKAGSYPEFLLDKNMKWKVSVFYY